MIHRNICPICGSENPEGSEFCQVCKANLNALPVELFPSDLSETEHIPETGSEPVIEEKPNLDSPVPSWLKTRLQPSDKMDFDDYSNMIFGLSPSNTKSGPQKRIVKPQKPKKSESVYQPPLQQNLIEPPLIEPDENGMKYVSEDIPGIADFLLRRPARKWEDRKPIPAAHKGSSVALLTDFKNDRPAKKWDDRSPSHDSISRSKKASKSVSQLPLCWRQDPPLIETDEAEDALFPAGQDDPALVMSVSPTKLINAADFFEPETILAFSDNTIGPSDEFEPESGTLLSDLMNEINSNSGSLSPAEQQENQDGTVFYSGNHPEEDGPAKPENDLTEISLGDDDNAASAEVLDRILRNIGYEVEGESPLQKPKSETDRNKDNTSVPETAAEDEKSGDDEKAPDQETDSGKPHGIYIPQVIDNPLIPADDEEESADKDADPYGLEEKISEKNDSPDDQEIPWDLFGSADMALPQSPEAPEYRTFSRSGIPEDPDNTTYQQRMISSILGKIIHAENFVQIREEKNERAISLGARLFLALLAFCGVVLILTTGFTDRFVLPDVPASADAENFYSFTESVKNDALVVLDYTPAYDSLMSGAADKLLDTLESHAKKVYLAALNPSSMTTVRQILNKHEEKIEFSGWWPAGVISIRSHLAEGNIPDQIWLLTSESISVRSWAEQLSVSGESRQLHVMGPRQLEPLMKPYLQADLITSMLCRDEDLTQYGEAGHPVDRAQIAVWYLAALVPLAWVFGVLADFLKTEPKYGRKSTVKKDDLQKESEKEPENA